MAAIPAYLIVGDFKGLCGTQPTEMLASPGATAGSGIGGLGALGYANAITFWTFGLSEPWLMRTVPITFSGEPDYAPWWDGSADGGAGAFRKYHHIPSAEFVIPFVPDSGGDNWFSGTKTFGWSAGFMEALGRKHRNNPAEGFRCLKFGYSAGVADLWGGAGKAAFDALDAELDAMEAAMGSDTLDWRAIIIDWSIADIEANTGTNYYLHALAAIASIRARLGDTTNSIPVFLVNHDRRLFKTSKTITPPGFPGPITAAEYTRILHGALAGLPNSNIRLVDRQSQNDLANNSFANAANFEEPNPAYYPVYRNIEFGRETLPRAIAAVELGTPAPVLGSGIPTILMIGDSQCAGSTNPVTAVYNGMPGELENAYIWNANTRQVEPYTPTSNALTAPAMSLLYYGTEYGAMKRALQDWPEVLCIKFGTAGANLTIEAAAGQAALGIPSLGRRTYDPEGNDLWPSLLSEARAAFEACVRDLGRVPDLRGAIVYLGDNDSMSVAGAEAFAAHIDSFVAGLRGAFTTRTTGDPLPVVWVKPPTHQSSGGQSLLGLAAARGSIRAAITEADTADEHLFTVDGDGFDLRQDDHIHYSGADIDELGAAVIQKLLDSSGDEGGTPPVVSGAAAFIVETGSGATDSNSFASVAFADDYHATYGAPSDWVELSVPEREEALRIATAYIEERYQGRWKGQVRFSEQALSHPRVGMVDQEGRTLAGDEVHRLVKEAACEVALRYRQGVSLRPDISPGEDGIGQSSITVGPISIQDVFRGSSATQPDFPVVTQKLRPLLTSTGSRLLVGLTR